MRFFCDCDLKKNCDAIAMRFNVDVDGDEANGMQKVNVN